MVAALMAVSVSAFADFGELSYAEGTVLRMATGYNNAKTGLSFDPDVAGAGITLADGNTYNSGDLKPTWVEVQNVLGIVIEDKYQGNSAANEFEYWKEQLKEVDVLSGTAAKLSEYGESVAIVANVLLVANLIWKFRLMKEEKQLIEAGKGAAA